MRIAIAVIVLTMAFGARAQAGGASALRRGIVASDDGDDATARRRFTAACDAGNARGCYYLGVLSEDEARGDRLIAHACRMRDEQACLAVAVADPMGEDPPGDVFERHQRRVSRALAAVVAGCQRRDDAEDCALAFYGDGYDVSNVDAFRLRALALAERRCRRGDAEACYAAAGPEIHTSVPTLATLLYRNGADDDVSQRRLLARGCALGSAAACRALDERSPWCADGDPPPAIDPLYACRAR